MIMPENAEYIIDTLYKSAYKAYIVGGCVRDFLLGEEPHDWDITTDARPEDVKQIFSHLKTVDTGLKHGTVTLVIEGDSFEITTYRTEGSYIKNRKPESVTFVTSLREDLKRRDFTVNAMAYNRVDGLKDYFGGKDDLKSGIIRCVGDPDQRLSEDALRIMRALRFASEKNFIIEEDTHRAMRTNSNLLKNISVERIASELSRTLMGKGVYNALKNYPEPLFEVIPELRPTYGFTQNNPHQMDDVYEHTIKSIKNSVPDLEIRLALLFHEMTSAEIAHGIMKRLKYDTSIIKNVVRLVENHSIDLIASEKTVKRRLSKFGEDFFRKLLKMKRADASATSPDTLGESLGLIQETEKIIDRVIKEGKCFSLKDLAINGNDLRVMGIPEGILIGKILEEILDGIIEGDIDNERHAIIQFLNERGDF
ncbi:CCA tRNA nucleotidyltransferase [Proteocatella sphenisci]|uniref:CCA tRNA nucleotidyltransferase n=1 Tax=Proteocatella sphenisci TaxID=181070 RepID=UPI00048E0783|nr:CCA tRNA nucleotidyltransferase [Proteocatella sphenisci]